MRAGVAVAHARAGQASKPGREGEERRGEREDKDLRGSEVLSGITLIVICGYRLDLAVDIRILE